MTTRAELLQRLRDTLANRRATRATLRDALQAAHDHLVANRAGRPRTPHPATDAVRAILARDPQAKVAQIAEELSIPPTTAWQIRKRLRDEA